MLKGRKHFSQSIMVSVAVSQLGKSSLVFVEREAKVNSSYYCDIVLHQDIEHLKEVLSACWDEVSQDTINRATGQFRKRLSLPSLVIAANGGHRLLNITLTEISYALRKF